MQCVIFFYLPYTITVRTTLVVAPREHVSVCFEMNFFFEENLCRRGLARTRVVQFAIWWTAHNISTDNFTLYNFNRKHLYAKLNFVTTIFPVCNFFFEFSLWRIVMAPGKKGRMALQRNKILFWMLVCILSKFTSGKEFALCIGIIG